MRLAKTLVFLLVASALFLGVPAGWLQIFHNAPLPVGRAIAAVLFCALLYGAMGTLVGAIPSLLWSLWLGRRERRRPGSLRRWPEPLRDPAFFGCWAVGLLVGEAMTFYGLTYEQTVIWHPQGYLGMAMFLALGALLCAVPLTAAVWLVWRATNGIRARVGWGLALVLLLVVIGVAAGLAAVREPAGAGIAKRIAVAKEHGASPVERIDTGISVVLLGFDGMDPDLIDLWVDEGRLPFFESLRRRGTTGRLRTRAGSNSAILWASIYSGRSPREHGVLDFFRVVTPLVPGGLFPVHRSFFQELTGLVDSSGLTRRRVVNRNSLRTLPVWEIADHYGLPIGVVDGYFYSYPALVPDTPESWFVAYGADSLREEEGQRLLADLPRYIQPVDLLALDQLPRGDDFEWQSATLLELLRARQQPKLVNFYCHQPDATFHHSFRYTFPQYYPPQFPPPTAEQSRKIVDLHESFDRFLAELTATAAPNTLFLLVSDHGHSPTMVHSMDTQHRHAPDGVVMMWGGPARQGQVASADLLDVFPTLLYLLGLPVPEDVPGKVLTGGLDPGFLERYPVRSIDTYEGRWRPVIQSLEQGGEIDERELEKLRALGYIAQ